MDLVRTLENELPYNVFKSWSSVIR